MAKQMFVANDGTAFDTMEAAESHDRVSGQRTNIQKWAQDKWGGKHGQATRAINTVLEWEKDRANVLTVAE